jgi:hypothetical protein
MCSVKTFGRKSCSVSWLSLAAFKLRDIITVRLSVSLFVVVTSTTLVGGRWNGMEGEWKRSSRRHNADVFLDRIRTP